MSVVRFTIASALMACCALMACRGRIHEGALPQRAWVWQRNWSADVHAAVATHDLDGLGVLSHEVHWMDGVARVVRVELPDLPRGTVRTVRVEVPPEGVDLVAALDPIMREACDFGPVHLDMDMPTRRLAEYAHARAALERDCDLKITSLPTWLSSPDVVNLVRGGHVLQLHGFNPDDPLGSLLFDGAPEIIRRADALGIPFEIALPTYGHRVWSGPGGELVRLDSEDGGRAPAHASAHIVLADPHRSRAVLDAIEAERPAFLHGVWWFRLPVAGRDQLAWSSETLSAVRRGELVDQVVVEERSHARGREICRINRGNTPYVLGPVRPERRPRLAGPRAGWTWSLAKGAFLPAYTLPLLQPGQESCAGWISDEVLHVP